MTELDRHSQEYLDQIELEVLVGKHLWLYASRRCACGQRPTGGLGAHYSWYMAHLAAQVMEAGYRRPGNV